MTTIDLEEQRSSGHNSCPYWIANIESPKKAYIFFDELKVVMSIKAIKALRAVIDQAINTYQDSEDRAPLASYRPAYEVQPVQPNEEGKGYAGLTNAKLSAILQADLVNPSEETKIRMAAAWNRSFEKWKAGDSL